MKFKDLLEKRGRVVTDMRQITETPAGDGGDLSAEQSTKFDALKASRQTMRRCGMHCRRRAAPSRCCLYFRRATRGI